MDLMKHRLMNLHVRLLLKLASKAIRDKYKKEEGLQK